MMYFKLRFIIPVMIMHQATQYTFTLQNLERKAQLYSTSYHVFQQGVQT